MIPQLSNVRAKTLSSAQSKTALDISEMSGELSIMASRVGLNLLAYILSMAHDEAESRTPDTRRVNMV